MVFTSLVGAGMILIGMSAGFVTQDAVQSAWYVSLIKPSFQPPSWIFGPVWTVLYFMIGVAGYRLLQCKNCRLFLLFCVQLILNLVWSWLFFGLQRIDLALIDLALLFIAVATLCLMLVKQNVRIMWWLIPYMLWLTFALVLNYQIYILNP